MKRQLSKVDGAIGKLIADNMNFINHALTKQSLVDKFTRLLSNSERKADAEDFLSTLKGCSNLFEAQTYLTNYWLAGDGLKVV